MVYGKMKISKTSKKSCKLLHDFCMPNGANYFFPLHIGFLSKIDIIRHQELENQLISRILRSNEDVKKIMKNHEIMHDLRMTCDDADEFFCFPI